MKRAFPFTRRLAIVSSLFTVLLPGAMAQQEIGYIEEFALAPNREEALKKLIPGTQDYYYFHTLHYQNTRQTKKLEDILAQWNKRFPNSGVRKQILHREALLNYSKDPKGSMEYIRRELGLQFNHQQEGKARAQELASTLKQEEVAWTKFLADALRGTKTLHNLDRNTFYDLLASGHELTGEQRRDLLKRADLPDLPNLVDIILADLKTKESRGFGEFKIHRALTIAQLDELRDKKTDLLRNENYVHNYLAKLRPGADDNLAADPSARLAYLERAWAFVKDLEPAFNSLKAHLLSQRLIFDYSQGKSEAVRFMDYVKLPRTASYIHPDWPKNHKSDWRTPANLAQNFSSVTGIPPLGSDEALVRKYLLHFLKDAKDYQPYAPYFKESWLKSVLAETKIVNGVGDPERWASLLSPSAFLALKNRVDIEFAPNSPEVFRITDQVKLRIHIKNVETLIVKVFEVNTLNYYLKHGSEVSTDLDLDGLVTNHERTLEYKEAPQRRIARDFVFPEIANRRGVWVIEFIGGSKSSRAVIRKGKLGVLTSTAGGGEVITILDEEHKPLSTAAVWFGGRRFKCDHKGRVLIPFSTNPGNRIPVIEAAGGFSTLARFHHSAESYQLHAGVQIDRESLRPGAKATIVVRPTLTVAGQPISLTRLSRARLILTSSDLDGVTTTVTVPDLKLNSDRETTHEFRVPNRLSSLTVQLRATVKVASQGKKNVDLVVNDSFQVNGQLRSDRVDDLYLSRVNGDYILEILGRTGEPRSGQIVNLTARRPGFKNTRHFSLKTDAQGGIDLGTLEGIASIIAEAPGGYKRTWQLPEARRTNPGLLHSVAGESVRVPFLGKLDRSEVAFHAQSSAGSLADTFDKLSLKDGFLVANKLEAADYRLLLKKSGQAITVRVAKGTKSNQHVFNEARTLELNARVPSHLRSLAIAGENLQIEVANSDQATRVHVIATRFLPDFDIFGSLGHAPQPGLFSGRPGRLPNLYLSGRKIGDEFRYILERRYAQKLPGNMLERPDILLNPWAVRDTTAENETLRTSEDYAPMPLGTPPASKFESRGRAQGKGTGSGSTSSSLDFLVHGPAQLLNLQPDDQGKITIPLAALGDRQHVHVLVLDHQGATYQELSLPERETAIADLRLLNALAPEQHFTEQDSVTLLKKGDTLEIPDLRTARFEVFEDLGSAYRYLLAMRDDPILREFGFMIDWPDLKEEEKRAKYSKYACHELNFFLSRKDPEFFKTVIAPYLVNKRDRTFFDQYLLDSKLSDYLAPFEYNRLNSLERILVSQRTPNRLDGIRMDLRDRLSLRAPDLVSEDSRFEGALAAQGLTFGRLNSKLDEAKQHLLSRQNSGAADPFGGPEASPAPAPEGATAELGVRSSLARNGLLTAKDAKSSAGRDRLAAPEEKLVELQKDMRSKAKEGLKKSNELYRKDTDKDGIVAFDSYADDLGRATLNDAILYRALESTKEWAESNYYRLPIGSHSYNLIVESKFWLDYARHEGDLGFGSRHLGEAARNVHEMILALAVLDLPFKTPESKSEIENAKLTFTAGANAIAFHREIKGAKIAENRPPLLVSQSYFRHGDRHRIENGEKVDKFVSEEFLAGVVYGAQVVVTNPTSSRQKLDVLIQIPRGAMPVLGHRATATQKAAMEPYTTQRFERFFYFPIVGNYPCYPAHVSKGGEVLAHTDQFTFNVVAKPSMIDETSWAHLSQWGTEKQVLAYLAKQNLHNINLAQIAWRCRESFDFFSKALRILEKRGKYNRDLYSYGIHHNHQEAARQFLLVDGRFLNGCGNYLSSELVTLDPVARRAYEHLEYKPLVNNRAHTVGGARKILNARIRDQYQKFLRILSEKPTLDHSDQLSVAYYHFLQDRAESAISRLDSVKAETLPTSIQYDYFMAYRAFYQSKPDEARAIAVKYANYPVNRWRERFTTVIAQADEIQGKAPTIVSDDNRDQQQAQLAAAEPTLELEVDGSIVTLSYEKLSNVQINYYEMDLEFLFSTNPFVSSSGGSFSVVQPNKTELLQLPDDKRSLGFELPRHYQSKNVLVEVIGGGKKRSQAVYSNELQISVSERYGILTVRHAKDGRPLPTTYVKIYALTKSGPKFYKDGYTDLRGKFDYASVSTSDIGDAQKFSVLVMSDENGATVLDAPVPQR